MASQLVVSKVASWEFLKVALWVVSKDHEMVEMKVVERVDVLVVL